jgi:hypothetical protein
MISARVLEKEFQSIQPRAQMVAKNYSIVNRCEEFRQQMRGMRTRIESKRELLEKMKSKRNAISLWLDKKGRVKEKEQKQGKL